MIDPMYKTRLEENFEMEDDPYENFTEECANGDHAICPDVDANCCNCSCHHS